MSRFDLLPSRRAVLTGGVAAMALSACGSETASTIFGGSSATATSSAPPLATAEAAAWIAAAGTTFNAGGRTMRLAGVELIGSAGGRPPELRQQGFIAVFDMVDGAWMAGDRTYTISHATIPTFNIHLNNSTSSPLRMVASFN